MSTIDLSALPAPQVLEPLDFEAIYQEELDTFRLYMGDNWSAALESDPVVKLLELAAYRRLQNRARVNDAAKSLLLAYAEDGDLDQLAANVNLKRLVIQAANPLSVPPVAEAKESNDALRERVQLAFEGLTTAGPRNSYILHARSASALVGDATAESPAPAEVILTVQALHGNGAAEQSLLEQVAVHVNDDDVRPLGDRLTVRSTQVLEFSIQAALFMERPGSQNEAILAEANRRLAAWINPRRRLGVEVSRSAIDAQVHLPGVRRVDLKNWVDIVPTRFQSAYCTGFSVVEGGGDAQPPPT